ESQSDFHQTPTLEAMAREGLRFSSAYVSPMCVPTQMALQTGKSWARLQRTDNVNNMGYDFPLMPPVLSGYPNTDPRIKEEISIAQRIKEVHPEYQTGHFGKYAFVLNDWGYFDTGVLNRDTLPEELDPKLMFTFATKANEFIQESVDADKPFFAMFTHKAVKIPIEALAETITKYENLPRGKRHRNASYAAMTEDLDTSVGMVLEKIRDLGVEDNTYVIYVSDNGRGQGANLPLSGGKGGLKEGGIRVPLIIKGPGIAPGTVSDVPVIVTDLFTTITELTGNTYPLQEEVEGASLVPILQNGGQLPANVTSLRRPYGENGELFFHYTRPDRPQSAVIDGDFKLLKYYGNPGQPDTFQLYNLADDLSESNNLAGAMPDKVAELDQKLKRWLQGVDASLPYDVAAPMQLAWNADDLGKRDDVELAILKASIGTDRPRSDLNSDGIVDQRDLEIKLSEFPKTWRSTIDVDFKARETWTLREGDAKPQYVRVLPHQPNLAKHAFRFDGDDGMERMYFHVTNPDKPDTFDNSASLEFWVRLDSMAQPHMLFESGGEGKGLSVTFGDADNDGDFDELRFRANDDNGDFITVTSEFDLFADPTRDFVQIVAVLNDSSAGRYAELYVNGALFGRVDGVGGTGNYIDWDGTDEAGLGQPGGDFFGGTTGGGDQPFTGGNFSGELAYVRFYNYAINGNTVRGNYNAMLDDVDLGIAATSGAVQSPMARPSNVSEGAIEADDTILVIQERSDVLDDVLPLDILPVGGQTYGEGGLIEDIEGQLPADTEFTSYLLHFDPAGDPGSLQNVFGTVTFSRPIQGIIVEQNSLEDTDAELGVMGQYSTGSRAVDLAGDEFLTISGDLYTLTVSLNAVGDEIVQLRVLTERFSALTGDMDFDGDVDFDDIEFFVLGVTDAAAYEDIFGAPPSVRGDTDGDGKYDFDDIAEFVALVKLHGSIALQTVPEPPTLLLAAIGLLGAGGYRWRR
ncbi:MAG: sulfatase-like hydrolase/transferase, partial [Pirellulales bacterium]